MAYTILDNDESFHIDQSRWMQSDIDVLVGGLQGSGVDSGCTVAAQGSPNMTVAIAAGILNYLGSPVPVAAGNVTIAASDATNPRIDIIAADKSGVKTRIAGTAAANPKAPTFDNTLYVGLAFVYVPANATTIINSYITDKRVILELYRDGSVKAMAPYPTSTIVDGGDGLTNSQTSVGVANGTLFVIGTRIQVDNEQMTITNIASNTLTVTRAANGTAGATHAEGAIVSQGPRQTIDLQALITANAGKTIHFRPGTYNGLDQITLPASTALLGAPNKTTLLTLRLWGTAQPNLMFYCPAASTKCTIAGFDINGRKDVNLWAASAHQWSGIIATNASYTTFSDLYIHDVRTSAIYASGGPGTSPKITHLIFDDNRIENIDGAAFFMEYNITRSFVRRNRCKSVLLNGIKLKGTDINTDIIEWILIEGNLFDYTGMNINHDAIINDDTSTLAIEATDGADYIRMMNNTIMGPLSMVSDSFFGISIGASRYCSAIGNHVFKDPAAANTAITIALEAARSVAATYIGNTVYGCNTGLQISNSNPLPNAVRIIGNHIEQCEQYAIEIVSGEAHVISGNTIVDGTTRGASAGGSFIMLNSALSQGGSTVTNCIVSSNAFVIKDFAGPSAPYGLHVFQGGGHMICDNQFYPQLGGTSTYGMRSIWFQVGDGLERVLVRGNRFNGRRPSPTANADALDGIEISGPLDQSVFDGNQFEWFTRAAITMYGVQGRNSNRFINNQIAGNVVSPPYAGLRSSDLLIASEEDHYGGLSASARIFDDFTTFGTGATGAIGDLSWALTNGTTPLTNAAAVAGRAGILQMNSSATTGTRQYISLYNAANAIFHSSDSWEMQFSFRIPTTDANTVVRIGFGTGALADPPTGGVFVEKLLADTSLFGVCRSGGSQTRTTVPSMVAVIVANAWYKLTIKKVAAADVRFRVDGAPSGANMLGAAITNVATTLTVVSAASFPAVNNYRIQVGLERMDVTAGAGTTSWTVTRAVDSTSGVAHPRTTLNGALTATQNTIVVTSATNFPAGNGYVVQVDSERMYVIYGSGTTTWTVLRGYEGTTAATHSNAAGVSEAVYQYNEFSITSNIPSAAVTPFAMIGNGTNAIRNLDIDYYDLKIYNLAR